MKDIDELFITILSLGLASLRDAARAGDWEYCREESQHLHEIPSGLRESGVNSHEYYMNVMRREFTEWADSSGNARARDIICYVYERTWRRLKVELTRIGKTIE